MLDAIVGHGRAKSLLASAVRSGRPAHAYLFVGPDRVGKTALASVFACALDCQAEPGARACGVCGSCRRFATGAHPDFMLIERDLDKRGRGAKNIPIETVRGLQHDASLSAHLGPFKVYVVVRAEELSLPAMDSLLKTLEEPAPRVVVILTCADIGLLPETIVSRCQVLKLSPVPADELAAWLVAQRGIEHDRADLLAHLAAGRPGWAITTADQPEGLTERSRELGALIELDRSTRSQRLKYAERMAAEHSKDPAGTFKTLELLLSWWRDVLLMCAGCAELVVNWDRLPELRERAAHFTVAQSRGALRAIETTHQYLGENVQPRLALELLTLSLPRPA